VLSLAANLGRKCKVADRIAGELFGEPRRGFWQRIVRDRALILPLKLRFGSNQDKL